MKKLLASFCLISALNIANAQQVTINWGEESKTETSFNSFVAGQNNSMIKLCFESHGGMFSKPTLTPVLTRYTDKLSEAAVRRFEVDEKNISFNDLLSIKNKLFLFTSQYDNSVKATTFYTQQVDINTLNAIGKPVNLGSFDAINRTSTSTVGYTISKDSTKILMFGLSPYSKKENEKYYIGVYDSDMKKLWEQTIELPYKDKYVQIIDHLITNEGKVAVILKHYDQEVLKEAISSDGDKIPAYKTKFLLYDDSKQKPAEYILDIDSKFVHKLQVTDDKNGKLYLFGLYKIKYNGNVNGFFTATIDKASQKVTTSKLGVFPEQLVNQIKIDKQGSNKESDPGLGKEYRLAQIVERPDGTKDYLLEFSSEIYVPATSYYGSNGWQNRPAYWKYGYGNIVNVSLKPNGSVIITRIPKLQNTINIRIYSNFKALAYKDKLVVFYNDEPDNIERDINKRPDDVQKFNKSVLAMAVIDAQGNLTRSIVQENKDSKLIPAIRVSTIIGNDRLGLYAQKGGGIFSAAKDMVGILQLK